MRKRVGETKKREGKRREIKHIYLFFYLKSDFLENKILIKYEMKA